MSLLNVTLFHLYSQNFGNERNGEAREKNERILTRECCLLGSRVVLEFMYLFKTLKYHVYES